MKRLILTTGIIALLAGGVVASLPLFVSSATVRGYILDHLSELSGREISFRGDPRVSFKPFLGIEISDMQIADPAASPGEAPLLSVSKIQAQLDILPALFGQIKITQYRLERPKLNLKIYGDGNSNWHFKSGKLRQAYEDTQAAVQNQSDKNPVSATLGTFLIVDGVIEYEDTIADKSEAFTSLDGFIHWPASSEPMEVSGTGVWQGENIQSQAILSEPLKMLAGGQSETQWQFESAPAAIEFSGVSNTLSDLFIKGKIDLKTPSVKRLSDFMTSYFGQVNFDEALEVSGDIEATAAAIRITEAKMNIAGHAAMGVISLSRDEVEIPSLDGTLAFDTVDLSDYLAQEGDRQEEATEENDDLGLKIDLRVSANSINTGMFELEQVAAAVNATDEKWTFDIGDAQVFDGNVVAKLSKQSEAEEQPLLILEMSATDINTAELFALMPEKSVSLAGKGSFKANLRSSSMREFLSIRGVNGTFTATIDDGNVVGIDIPTLLSRATSQETPDVDGMLLGHETPFHNSNFKLFINNGIASVSQSTINSPLAQIRMIGRIDLRHGNLALRAQEVSESGPEPERMFIGGTLRAPLVTLQKSNGGAKTGSNDTDTTNVSN